MSQPPFKFPVVLGASGFIGKHLIKDMGLENCIPVSRYNLHSPWLTADLLDLNSLMTILKPGMTVINLAYSNQTTPENNIKMVANLIKACKQVKVAKVVHCSTAVVVGANSSYFVNEDTECLPETPYEKTKYQIETMMLAAIESGLQVCVMRPTGVIGPSGQNLKKMLTEISLGKPIMNWFRSSLYGNRPLNLVPVKDVIRALLHLCNSEIPSGVYICSADEDSDNQYQRLESIMRFLIMKQSKIKPISFSPKWLNLFLRLRRKGCGRIAQRYYSAEKLYATGFKRSMSISDAVKEFVTEVKT